MALIGLFAGNLALGQSYTWRNVEIGGCGFVTGTVFHPTEPGLVYARTDVGGAYRLDSTTEPLDRPQRRHRRHQQRVPAPRSADHRPRSERRQPRLYRHRPICRHGKLEAEFPHLPFHQPRATWTYTTPGFKMAGNGEGRGTGERMAVDPSTAPSSSSAPTTSASGAAPTMARAGHVYRISPAPHQPEFPALRPASHAPRPEPPRLCRRQHTHRPELLVLRQQWRLAGRKSRITRAKPPARK
jgi:hypothetical protein